MPITNLEFTYCEEKQSAFFPPGLRLEADVLLTESLQWASDALKSMFGGQKTPNSLHLSAHLADERDWTKRPRVEKFVLQGYFYNMDLKTWDFLQFNTMGVEIIGTKAASSKKAAKTKNNEQSVEKPLKDAPEAEDEKKAESNVGKAAGDAKVFSLPFSKLSRQEV